MSIMICYQQLQIFPAKLKKCFSLNTEHVAGLFKIICLTRLGHMKNNFEMHVNSRLQNLKRKIFLKMLLVFFNAGALIPVNVIRAKYGRNHCISAPTPPPLYLSFLTERF